MFSEIVKLRLDAAAATLSEATAAGVVDLPTLHEILEYFKDSEAHLLHLLGALDGAPPKSGDLEFGAALYQLETHLEEAHPELWKIFEFFKKKLGIHASFDPAEFAHLFTTGVVGGDGTLVAAVDVAKFAQLDPGWIVALIEYIQLKLKLQHKYSPFPTCPAVATVGPRDTVRIAVVGDWGSGPWGNGLWGHEDHGRTAPAFLVMDQIETQSERAPWDFTIHLGDVYYGGTFAEERANLLPHWVAGSQGTFTLNSNHEMYDGARGYFSVALAPDGPFKGQQQTSYFAIESDSWAIVGLDSAYYDESPLFMDGALVDKNQISFLAGYSKKPTVIVMTHHNPFNVAGTRLTKNKTQGGLWNNVVGALGRAPDYWYWGHVHNGVAYKRIPGRPGTKATQGIKTRGRCVGHGALPFGKATDIVKRPGNVDYYAHTPMPDPVLPYQKLRVLNGWVELTVGNGRLTEGFVEAGGDARQPVWTKSWELPGR